MFAAVGRARVRMNVPMAGVRGARYKREKPLPRAAPAAPPPAAARKKRSNLLAEALAQPRGIPEAGAQLKNKELVAEAEELERGLDTEGVGEEEMMGDVTVSKLLVDLPDDPDRARQAEERHFQGFFGKGDEAEPEAEPSAEDEAMAEQETEVVRKLGLAAVARERVEDLRDQEEDAARRSEGSKQKGFEQRGRRDEADELEENEAKERQRQRRVHLQDDNLMVGDVVVPGHLEKWVLDPMGDHRQRHKKQRLKEERLNKWYELHGMYYERRKQSGFKRDPVDTEMTIRQKRVSMLVQEALEKVLAVDFEHEAVPALFIEGVEMSVDMRRCKILWGSEEKGADGFLHRMGPTIRMMLTKRVQLKFSPTLEFVRTDFEKKHVRVDTILETIDPAAEEQGEGQVEEAEDAGAEEDEAGPTGLSESEMRELERQMERPENLRAHGNGEEAQEVEEEDEEDEEDDDDEIEEEGEDDEEDEDDEEEEEEDPEFEEWFKKIPIKVTYV